ncbi:hypothetical protein FSP39_017955 [Pinctada imbricata]|uniref:Nitrate/nitrite transporter n=1 Tax=Pinctada imbricata TaxID=66713 RepID=A0AA88YJW8_PINIB|nr:hypothetical protein FSP39_017955 [Pinctada imbricata]
MHANVCYRREKRSVLAVYLVVEVSIHFIDYLNALEMQVEIANTGTASVAATIIVRVIIGPLCDRFGPRRVMSALLIGGAIPMALTGLVKNGIELLVVRLCIGILGGCFVPCQFWTSVMFNSKIVGTANAVVGGWGNLGGGFTFILMPGIFEGVKAAGADPFLAWKISVVIPAVVCIGIGILILFTADDSPQGSWSERLTTTSQSEITANGSNKKLNHTLEPGFDQKPTTKVDVSVPEPEEESTCSCKRSFWLVVTVVILIIHYGMCFGIEISVNTVLNLYLLYKFKKPGCVEGGSNSLNSTIMSTTATLALNGTTLPPVTTTVDEYECSVLDQTTASLIASLFGLMNLFARALGGLFSDVLRSKFALPGRILGHMICMLGEGVMLIIFSQIETVPIAVLVIIFFSLFVQMSEGTTYCNSSLHSP